LIFTAKVIREAALQRYLDKIAELLLDEKLRESYFHTLHRIQTLLSGRNF
jgi:hypothetical protein